uniref:Uncharacterized protein n=1 Tax=Rhizophora mucronata TaxID=61149 RepID=A0A2P2QQU7_RHIMU
MTPGTISSNTRKMFTEWKRNQVKTQRTILTTNKSSSKQCLHHTNVPKGTQKPNQIEKFVHLMTCSNSHSTRE